MPENDYIPRSRNRVPRPLPELSEETIQRFKEKVDTITPFGKNGDCHRWTAYVDKSGYGIFATTRDRGCVRAHRVAFLLHYGYDPSPLIIRHTCSTPGCVNAAHLLSGTQRENVMDMVADGNAKGNRMKPKPKQPKKPSKFAEIKPLPTLTETDIEKFLSHTEAHGDCLMWIGNMKRDYGNCQINNNRYSVNRIAYLIHFGSDPGDMQVLHTCLQKNCLSKQHMFLGTRKEKAAQLKAAGKQANGSSHGMAKMNHEKAVEAKRRYDSGETLASIAKAMDVSIMTISLAIRGKTPWLRMIPEYIRN